jgi:hypothetical protein
MAVFIQDGKILIGEAGKVAVDQNCCCPGVVCPNDWPSIYVTVNTTDTATKTVTWCGESWSMPDDDGKRFEICPSAYVLEQERRDRFISKKCYYTKVYTYTTYYGGQYGPYTSCAQVYGDVNEYRYHGHHNWTSEFKGLNINRDYYRQSDVFTDAKCLDFPYKIVQRSRLVKLDNPNGLGDYNDRFLVENKRANITGTASCNVPSYIESIKLNTCDLNVSCNPNDSSYNDYQIKDSQFGEFTIGQETYKWEKGKRWP